MQKFKFLDPGKLIDDDLELVLIEKYLGDETKGYFPSYEFEMKNVHSGEKMGYISLRVGYNDNTKFGGHIGYGVDEKFRSNHYAGRSLKLIFPLAKKHGLTPICITCNLENIPSRKTCEFAGGELLEIVDLPPDNDNYKKGDRKKCRYIFNV